MARTSHHISTLHNWDDYADLSVVLAHNVHELRIAQHITISALSRVTKISRPLLAKIEKGEADVRLSYIKRLAGALCVDPFSLLEP